MPFDATPVTSPVIELLEKVHARLRKGWAQGKPYDRKTNSYCLVGALFKETNDNKRESKALEVLGFNGVGRAVWWNDEPGRTKAQVLRKIRLAIQKQREKLLFGG